MSDSILTFIDDYDNLLDKDRCKEVYHLQPCAKYLSNTPEEQMKHIGSELGEAWEALSRLQSYKGNAEKMRECLKYDLGMELTDIKAAVETMLQLIGFNPTDRLQLCHDVNEKNRERGYWDC